MACDLCWAVPQPAKKHSYLVHLLDAKTNEVGLTIVQTPCVHDVQEWLQDVASRGDLVVVNPATEERFTMRNPMVMHIDAEAAAHIPIVDPDPVN